MKTPAFAAQNATSPLAAITIDRREPGKKDVALEIMFCGVCHSDLHFWKGEYNLGGGVILNNAAPQLTRLVRLLGFPCTTTLMGLGGFPATDPQFTGKGLLLDVDGTLRKTRSGELFPRSAADVELLPGRREQLQRFVDEGYQLFLVSNQSGVASGTLSKEDAEAAFARTIELLGLPIAEVVYCPHPAFPVGCFCRKPLPGLGVALIARHRLARAHMIMVGDMDSDRDFARALGVKYFDADEFFAPPRAPAG